MFVAWVAGCIAPVAPPPASGCRLTRIVGSDGGAVSYRYDAHGQEVESLHDRDGDGSPDHRTTHTWDAHGRRLSTVYDYLIPGTSMDHWPGDPHDTKATYLYDDRGHCIQESLDDDLDGTVNRRYDLQYDDRGNKIESVLWDLDRVGLVQTDRWTWDAAGKEISHALFYPSGLVIERTEIRYDHTGREVGRTSCLGDSWVPVNVPRFLYDRDRTWICRPSDTTVRTWRADGYDERITGDGTRYVRASTDERGDVIRREIDDDGDGAFESWAEQTWQCP